MRVAITGATGNVGTSVLAALAGDPAVTSIVGIARRAPTVALPKVEWRTADVVRDDLMPVFRAADAVVHLTWIVQPNHRETDLRAVNVGGSRRVHEAVAASEVPVLVHASAACQPSLTCPVSASRPSTPTTSETPTGGRW
ncbi:MAG: NAD-dependent epimerase/dehydratase family protein [Acidimicrobiales bacterium]